MDHGDFFVFGLVIFLFFMCFGWKIWLKINFFNYKKKIRRN
jgi:hypothetical protein